MRLFFYLLSPFGLRFGYAFCDLVTSIVFVLNTEIVKISRININKILNKNSKIINAFIINKNIHLFMDDGQIIILDQNLEIQETINLKIKHINKVYNYQNKIFISTEKGITYIY